MGLALIMIEEYARGAVQLRNHNTLGAVNDKGAIFSHQGYFTHVDFLLFDVLDRFIRRFFIVNDQPDFDSQRRRISNTA